MTKEFAKSILEIPTVSGREDLMVEKIKTWCRENGVACTEDSHHNLYLKKGGGSFLPCVTSHMDTVHRDQEEYIDRNEMLPIEERGDKLYIPHGPNGQQTGVGADCKAGIAVCLAIVANQPNIKACFFVKEEVGMQGSNSLDTNWFNDVAYVIGFDSPEHNRAAKACSGTPLFDDEFFNNFIRDTAAKHGVDNFKWEPYTDVLNIRKKTEIICMNFGNGGWHPHQKSEYVMFSEMNEAEALGNDLINTIPLDKQYKLVVTRPSYQISSPWSSWSTTSHKEDAEVASVKPYTSSRLAQLAQIRADARAKEEARKQAEQRSSRPGEERPDDFGDDWEDLWREEPSDAELDNIEQEDNHLDMDEFFNWLNGIK